MKVLFIDQDSVLNYIRRQTNYRVEMPEQMAFKANLKIPPDTTAIAFSYRGRAFISGESGRGGGWDFWQGP